MGEITYKSYEDNYPKYIRNPYNSIAENQITKKWRRDLHGHFSQRSIQMPSRYMKT
jgi:hypothetical protein